MVRFLGALGALGGLAFGGLVFGVMGGVNEFVCWVSENADAMIACAIGSSCDCSVADSVADSVAGLVAGSVAGLVERLRVRVAEAVIASSAFTFSDMYLDGNMSDNNRFTSRRSYDVDDADFVAFVVAFVIAFVVAFVNDAAVAVAVAVDLGGLTSVVMASLPLALMPTNSFSTSLSVASLSGEGG